MPRLFFVGDIGDIQFLQALYAFECNLPNERVKGKVRRGFVKRYWDLKQNLRLQTNLESLNVRYGPKLLRNWLRSAYMRLACDWVQKINKRINKLHH